MFNWLIKLLGGYTKAEYNNQWRIAYNSQIEIKRVLYIIANQQEKLRGALVRLFTLYGNSPTTCYDLADSITKEITERTNRVH